MYSNIIHLPYILQYNKRSTIRPSKWPPKAPTEPFHPGLHPITVDLANTVLQVVRDVDQEGQAHHAEATDLALRSFKSRKLGNLGFSWGFIGP